MLTLKPGGGAAVRVALSADGGRIVVLRAGPVPVAWAERPDWRWRNAALAYTRPTELAVDPAGRYAAVAGPGTRVTVCDLDAETSFDIGNPAPHDYGPDGLLFTPDGRELRGASRWARTRWTAGTWERHDESMPDHFPVEYRAVWPGPGGRLAALTPRGPLSLPVAVRVGFLTDPGGPAAETGRFHDHGSAVAFSPDGDRFALCGGTFTSLRVWDTATAATLVEVTATHGPRYAAPAFTPDGRTLLTGRGSSVAALDADTGDDRGTLDWAAGRVTALAVAADGLTAAAGTNSGRVVIWDLDG